MGPGGSPHPLLPSHLPRYALPRGWGHTPTVEAMVRAYWQEEGTLRGYLMASWAAFWPRAKFGAVIVLDFESDRGMHRAEGGGGVIP